MMLRHNSPDWILLFLLPPRCPQSLSLSFKCHDPMNEHPIIYVHNSKTSAFLLSKNKSHQELKPTRALVPSLQFDLHFRKKQKNNRCPPQTHKTGPPSLRQTPRFWMRPWPRCFLRPCGRLDTKCIRHDPPRSWSEITPQVKVKVKVKVYPVYPPKKRGEGWIVCLKKKNRRHPMVQNK